MIPCLVLVLAGAVATMTLLVETVRAQPVPQSTEPQPAQPPAVPVPRIYHAGGRRDPFVILLTNGSHAGDGESTTRPSGMGGLLVSEVALIGVIQSQTGFAGLLQAPDGRVHVVRVGDRLFDGHVRSIASDALVLAQRTSDSPAVSKEVEVRRSLRQIGTARR